MPSESATSEVQNHAIRLYDIRCAEQALKFAPLPEFKDAITVLRWYDDSRSLKSMTACGITNIFTIATLNTRPQLSSTRACSRSLRT